MRYAESPSLSRSASPYGLGVARERRLNHAIGLGLVLGLHAAALYGLWNYRLIPPPKDMATLFVSFISPPAPPPEPEVVRKPPPPREVRLERPRPIERPPPQQLVVEAPVSSPAEPVAPPPPPAPVTPAPVVESPPPAARPAGPVSLGGELSVSCPERTPPPYPAYSRRIGEQGRVVLRVELDEQGKVKAVTVANSSGSSRLDDAAASAVRTWRCNPAHRDGQAVSAVALQPFEFKLEGR